MTHVQGHAIISNEQNKATCYRYITNECHLKLLSLSVLEGRLNTCPMQLLVPTPVKMLNVCAREIIGANRCVCKSAAHYCDMFSNTRHIYY